MVLVRSTQGSEQRYEKLNMLRIMGVTTSCHFRALSPKGNVVTQSVTAVVVSTGCHAPEELFSLEEGLKRASEGVSLAE